MTSAFRALTLALVSLSTVVLAHNPSLAAQVTFVDAPPTGTGTVFVLESITDLDIDGKTYNVSFHHGVSFDSLANAITFNTPANAVSALNAIVNFINSEGIDASTATAITNSIVVPYGQAGPNVLSVKEVNLGLNPLNYSDFDIFPFQPAANPLAVDSAYATFVSIPEPSTFLLGIMATLICYCCVRPPRRRAGGQHPAI